MKFAVNAYKLCCPQYLRRGQRRSNIKRTYDTQGSSQSLQDMLFKSCVQESKHNFSSSKAQDANVKGVTSFLCMMNSMSAILLPYHTYFWDWSYQWLERSKLAYCKKLERVKRDNAIVMISSEQHGRWVLHSTQLLPGPPDIMNW